MFATEVCLTMNCAAISTAEPTVLYCRYCTKIYFTPRLQYQISGKEEEEEEERSLPGALRHSSVSVVGICELPLFKIARTRSELRSKSENSFAELDSFPATGVNETHSGVCFDFDFFRPPVEQLKIQSQIAVKIDFFKD